MTTPARRAAAASAGAGALALALAFAWARPTDFAASEGDTLEYQSLGANLALGFGFPTFGPVAPLAAYRFETFRKPGSYYAVFLAAGAEGGRAHFYRAPGYPLFLAAVYRVFGVRPAAAKSVQLLLVVLIAASLPWLGFRLWGEAGTLAGALAAPLFVLSFARSADYILSEPVVAASLWLVVVAFLRWSAAPSAGRCAALGASLGLALLVKASSAFVPPLALAALAAARDRPGVRWTGWRAAVVAGAAAASVVAPYSAFATLRSGRLVVVSTQGSDALLDDNNELALRQGSWAKEWRSDAAALYNQPGWRELPPAVKVLRFYARDPTALPRALRYKLNAGLGRAFGLKLVMAWLILAWLLSLGGGRPRRLLAASRSARLFFLLVAGLFVLAAVFGATAGALLTAGCLLAAAASDRKAVPAWDAVPAVFWVMGGNFLLIFAVFDGNYRFISVIEWLCLLQAAAFALAGAAEFAGWSRGEPGPTGLLAVPRQRQAAAVSGPINT